MLPSLDNFVSYGTDVFKARADYRQMALDIYTTSIASEQLGENDRVNGCKLAESILLNMRGHADDVCQIIYLLVTPCWTHIGSKSLQTIIITALDHLERAETAALRLANLEVLINAVLYNPSAALLLMESSRPGMARVFFDKWFAAINAENLLPRVHDKKLSIMALCALLEMVPPTIPETLKDGWHGIVAGILKIFKDLPRAIEGLSPRANSRHFDWGNLADRKALEDSFQEESEDEDSIDDAKFLNLNEDDGMRLSIMKGDQFVNHYSQRTCGMKTRPI